MVSRNFAAIVRGSGNDVAIDVRGKHGVLSLNAGGHVLLTADQIDNLVDALVEAAATIQRNNNCQPIREG